MQYSYQTHGVCSRRITFDLEDGCVRHVRFQGGCSGNTQGVAALVAAGVINTPEYWLANYGTFPSLDLLLQALGGAVK